jgi:L-lactate utilization protein LutB
MNPEEILNTAKKMKTFVSGPHTLAEVLEIFGDFKQRCPHLFEMVLENKGNYMGELEAMVSHATKVKEGAMSYSDATKVVKNVFDNRYIFPMIKSKTSLTPEQKLETENFIRKQQEESDEIMKKTNDK